MSHFTMLVAGADPDYQLAPFHEFECTGLNDEFVKDIDVTSKEREEFREAMDKYAANLAKYNAGEMTKEEFDKATEYEFKGQTFLEYIRDYEQLRIAESETELRGIHDEDYEGIFKYGYALHKDGDDYQIINRTNPNSKWDWYQTGGRWGGLLLLKGKQGDGSDLFSDCATKGEIDFEEMWRRDEESRRTKYRKVIEALGGVPTLEHTWASLVAKFSPRDENIKPTLTRDEAIKIYDAQPSVIKFKNLTKNEELDLGWFASVDDFCCTEDEYVSNGSIHAITFGFVVNREWHEKAEMGWWACTSNEKDPQDWDKSFKEFIESLDDDVLLTVIDCHI